MLKLSITTHGIQPTFNSHHKIYTRNMKAVTTYFTQMSPLTNDFDGFMVKDGNLKILSEFKFLEAVKV